MHCGVDALAKRGNIEFFFLYSAVSGECIIVNKENKHQFVTYT